MTKYGYARVSTLKQDLTEQISEIINHGVSRDHIYTEKMTGTKADRPKWDKLMKVVKRDDVIYVTKLDRLGRLLQIILKEIDELTKKLVYTH